MKCKDNPKIVAIYLIEPNDIKTMNPLVLKRKYGKFKRKVIKHTCK